MDKALMDELIAVMHRFKKVGKNFHPDMGLNMGEFFILERIARNESCTGNDISDAETHHHPHFTKPAVSQMLNSLEKKGFVFREIDKNDRRRIVVTLTSEGRKMLEKAKAYFDERMTNTIEKFGEDNTRQLISLINLLTDSIEDLKDGNLE